MTTPTVAGYQAVDVHFTSQRWGGLERRGGSPSLLDGSVNHADWYYAVGAREPWGNGFPGPDSASVSVIELYAWCQCALLPSS